MKRRCRQPSRQVRRCGGRERPSGKLHPGCAESQPLVGVLPKSTQPAMHVADGRVKKHAADVREHRVADPPVGPDHRAGFDTTIESVAHDQVKALAQLVDERTDRGEVVAVIRVAHDHVAASRRVDATDQGAAVAPSRDVDHARAKLLGDHPRAVGAAVVGDDDLRRKAVPGDRLLRFADAGRDRFHLVETRHDDRKLDFGFGRVFRLLPGALRDAHGGAA